MRFLIVVRELTHSGERCHDRTDVTGPRSDAVSLREGAVRLGQKSADR
ncbi:MAG: hypothetical protein ABSC94_12185 [Polyangiaceae bacterium]|jgi:hypothetical protein